MIDGKKILALIPARGGSKGLPRKNILPLQGKPLIAWTIEAALQSQYIDRLILSSDDKEIMVTAQSNGCDVPFRRPPHLSGDTATTMDVVIHALEQLPGYDIIILLQPTSPLRTTADIDGILELLITSQGTSCVSVTHPDKSPFWSYSVKTNGQLTPLFPPEMYQKRRQDLPETCALNGAIYAVFTSWLQEHKVFVDSRTHAFFMPKERSIDIDSELDLKTAALLLGGRIEPKEK